VSESARLLSDDEERELLVALIASALRKARVPLSNEKATQNAIAELFAALDIDHTREHKLGPAARVDFFLPPNLVIEVKINRARPAQIFRQLVRYAKYETVAALVLVTNRAMGLPKTIGGKPAYYLSIGTAWL